MSRQLRIRYTEWIPWAVEIRKDNTSQLTGVMKDVYEALAHSLRYSFHIEAQADKVYGSAQPDGSYSGMLGAVSRNEVDLAGPLAVSEQRTSVVDFTNCLEFYKLGIITGIESTDRNMFLYIKVFSWKVWLLLFSTLLCVAFSSMVIHNTFVNNWALRQGQLLSRYLWIFGSHLVGHDCGTTNHWALVDIWYRHSFRILMSSWLLGPVLVILYTFQGTITSTFAVTKLRPIVADLQELGKKKSVIPVTTKGSAVRLCFMTSQEPLHVELWHRTINNSIQFTPENVEQTLDKVEKGTHALIIEYVYAASIVTERVKRTKKCTIQVQRIEFCSGIVALAFRKGLSKKIKRMINRKLTTIVQAKLTDRFLNRVFENYTHCSKQPSEGVKPLAITDIMGAFVLLAIGTAAAILFAAVEIISPKVGSRRKKLAVEAVRPRTRRHPQIFPEEEQEKGPSPKSQPNLNLSALTI